MVVDLEGFISRCEYALARGRSPEVDEGFINAMLGQLPHAVAPPLVLKRVGHRLWQVCSSAARARPPLLDGARVAAAQELACELIETGMVSTGPWSPRDQADLVLQWSMAGKAWVDLKSHGAAIRCLSRSVAAWDKYLQDGHARDASEAELDRLGTVSLQTQLWMAAALSRAGRGDQAFVALSKVAGMLRASPSLASVCLGLFMHACREEAATLREGATARLSVDVLELALTVLPDLDAEQGALAEAGGQRAAGSDTDRAEILRQLAQCHTDFGPGGLREAALAFASHGRVRLQDCLELCRDLADRGADEVCVACLAELRRVHGKTPDERSSIWLLSAQLLASRVGERRSTTSRGGRGGGGGSGGGGSGGAAAAGDSEVVVDALSELLDEVDAASDRPAGLAGKLASLLWVLAEALCRRGAPLSGAVWLHRALPLLAEDGREAAGWRALAQCHFAAGEGGRARSFAETALSHDATDAYAAALVLVNAAAAGEVSVVTSLLARAASGELPLAAVHFAFIVEEISKQHAPAEIQLECLEGLLRCAARDVAAAEEVGFPPVRVLRALAEAAAAAPSGVGTTKRLLGYLDAVVGLKALDEGAARWFLDFAWGRGDAAVEAGSWDEAVVMFERACTLLERCGVPPADVARGHAAVAQAMLEQARGLAAEGGVGADGAEAARELRRAALARTERARAALRLRSAASGAAGGGRDALAATADRVLARLAFEAMCCLQAPAPAHDEVAAAAAPGDAASLARLARIAADADDGERAGRCLRAYLRLVGASDDAGGRRAAAARRALAALRRPRGGGPAAPVEAGAEVARACEEAGALLRSLGGGGGGDVCAAVGREPLPACLPYEEALWLAATAWNAGVELAAAKVPAGAADAEQREESARRLRLGIELLGLLECFHAPDARAADLRRRLLLARPPAAAVGGA